MGNLLHIHDLHGRSQRLLPWLVNGTLNGAEEAELRAHLDECGECRADYERECELRALVGDQPIVPDDAWARLSAKVAQRTPSAQRNTLSLLGRQVSLQWAVGIQVAVAASLVLAFLALSPSREEPERGYRLLGSSEVRPEGNLIVLFAPETTEQAMRAVLANAGARIVDGPTTSGAYVLAVDPSREEEALASLRAGVGTVLAEPIGGGQAR